MSRFTSKRTYTIVLLLVLFFISITFYSNLEFYKQYIIDKIYSTIEFRIEFQESSLTFFPSPGIILNKVTINNKEGNEKVKAEFNTMEFLFSWKILFGEIELNNIKFKDGKLELSSLNKNFPDLVNKNATKSIDLKNVQKIFSFFDLDQITLNSIHINYTNDKNIAENFFFNFLIINSNHKDLLSLNFDLNYQSGNFKSETKIQYIKNDFNFNSLEIKSNLKFKNFSLKPFKEYYSIINEANFGITYLNGEMSFFKEKFKNEFNVKTELDINDINFIGDPAYPVISVSTELVYFPELKEVQFISLNVNYENGAIASANGSLTFAKDIYLNLNIKGDYADIYKVIYLIVRLVDFKNISTLNFYSHLKILVNRAVFAPYELKRIDLEFDINNTIITFDINNADTLSGSISGKAKVVASKHSVYEADISLKEINSEELILKYTQVLYVKGKLSTNFTFSSSGNSLDNFLENLNSTGKLEIKNGELLGYANILKPIFSLGKLVNVLGPKGKNTEFKSLSSDYSILSRNININNLKMIGVGIDAHGSGKIDFDRKIDFRIYTGLGGIAGKALYVPIIYNGIIPDNISYIDPVWIGSVYVGAILLAGPAGATVGGVAGSAVSEYVNRAWEGMKGIFQFDNSK